MSLFMPERFINPAVAEVMSRKADEVAPVGVAQVLPVRATSNRKRALSQAKPSLKGLV